MEFREIAALGITADSRSHGWEDDRVERGMRYMVKAIQGERKK